MVFLIVLLLLLLLIFFVPYGVDVSYEDGAFGLRVKAGPLRIRLLPKKPLSPRQAARKQKKQEKKEAKKKADGEKEAQGPKAANETIKVKPKKKIEIDLIFALLKMGARAVRRLFRSFSIDYFKLYYTAAGSDPYDTAMQYGYVCGAVETLPELAGSAIRVRRHDIMIGSDFTTDKPDISLRLIVSLQLYKIVYLAAAFGVEFIRWKINDRREKKAAAVSERKYDHGREQDQ